jgi:hypothetical protein
MLKSSFKSYFSYVCGLFKFHNPQVPYGTNKGTFAISQGVGLVGNQNIIDRFLIAHIKNVAHINVLPINSAICKFQMVLKIILSVPCLKWKSWG